MSGEAAGLPARGYSWPPFEPGNAAAVKHGALSPKLVTDDAAALLEALRETGAPWLDDVDAVALDGWLFALATCQRLRKWIGEHGDMDAKGRPRHAHRLLLSWERRLSIATQRLGFDPLARAQLGRDTAIAHAAAKDALDRVRATGRKALGGGS